MKLYVITTNNVEMGSPKEVKLIGVFDSEERAVNILKHNGWVWYEEGELYGYGEMFPNRRGWWKIRRLQDNRFTEIREVELNVYKDPETYFDLL